MRGRKSSRSAAVVLAGCVGLAVMAPGLALAAPDGPTSDAECVQQFGTGSTLDSTTLSGCTTPASVAGGTTSSDSTGDTAATTPSTTTTTPASGAAGSTGTTPSGTTPSGTAPSGTGTTSSGTTSSSTGPAGGSPSVARGTAPTTLAADDTEAGVTQLQEAVTAALPTDVTALVPIKLPTNLPFQIPTTIPTGGFTNPQQACGFFVSQLTAATPAEAAQLGTAAAAFCGSLPTSFTDFDPTDLIQDLLDIINGLMPSVPGSGGTIPTTPPSTVPAYYSGYWYQQYDVDCPELTGAEADALFAMDPSDPFNLDGDGDGIPCEDRGRTSSGQYVGYPVGGVSTGDGSTGTTDASPAVLALAGAGVGGLALSGLTLVRRFGRES